MTAKDLQTSRAFYEKLGFEIVEMKAGASPYPCGGRWLLMRNVTFKPSDVRAIQRVLTELGLTWVGRASRWRGQS